MCRSDESENREDFIWPCVLIFQKKYTYSITDRFPAVP